MASARTILGGLTAWFALTVLAAAPTLAQTTDEQQPAQQQTATENAVVEFDIPAQPLSSALIQLSQQAGVQVVMEGERAGDTSVGALRGEYAVKDALDLLLLGTSFTAAQTGPLTYTVKGPQGASVAGQNQVGQRRPGIEEIIVTGQKKEERIQDVPIAISAFTQEDLTTHQIAGGPDLITQIPNMTFTKTNFTGYSIQIRGIGTQAISATTDPAVAVAFNNTPFIRNRFFEQEFYDLERVEVLRGPQGTLYGRNATAGVVNLISAKPQFEEEAMFSVDYGGNYNSRRYEGMVNIPLVDDRIALRIAGAATKRDGYATNEITGSPIDGRDLWSTRVSLRVKPNDWINANLIWEHFEENDDRLRSGKQLCHQDDRVKTHDGFLFPPPDANNGALGNPLSQGCIAHSLYSEESFETTDGNSLPYYKPLGFFGVPIARDNPYAGTLQSSDLRVIESTVDPEYRAKSDIVELQLSFDVTDGLTLESETGYMQDSIFSMQDFNRFNTQPGAFGKLQDDEPNLYTIGGENVFIEGENGDRVFCDPQIGCADRLVAVDVSSAESEQFSQEFRLASRFDGPLNFSVGANYLNYETEDKYYVFINTLGISSVIGFNGAADGMPAYDPRTYDNHQCMRGRTRPDPGVPQPVGNCPGIDTNPIGELDDDGHNYFLSRNPYELDSYSAFGELYWNITDALKLTGGLRYTVDEKTAPIRPSWILAEGTVGYPVAEVIEQEWREPTGRLTLDWKPVLDFTDETLLYASYARGYKAGGANPPISGKLFWAGTEVGESIIARSATRPKTFDAEFVNAFEVGAKNTLFDGTVTLNMNAFYYDYEGYQISQIIDRSARNFNFDTEVWGAEIEADWWALENWRLAFKGGHQKTRVGDGEKAIDIMDRTAGTPGWVVSRPFPAYAENCILPAAVFGGIEEGDQLTRSTTTWAGTGLPGPCEYAYQLGLDPRTQKPYQPFPFGGSNPYPGFDPSTAPNNGEGFFKDLSGNELPNSPHYTMTLSTDYIVPLKGDWLMTLHGDVYHQTKAWTRIFNTPGYDRLRPYTTVNFAAIFANEESGWNVMAYIKNVFDRDAITGAFLNSDDTGLTTNVFLTEPRLFGLRVTKTWGDRRRERPLMNGMAGLFGREPDAPSPFSWEVGGMLFREDAPYETLTPESVTLFQDELTPKRLQNRDLDLDGSGQLKLTYSPHDKSWFVSGSVRFGKTQGHHDIDRNATDDSGCFFPQFYSALCVPDTQFYGIYVMQYPKNWIDAEVSDREEHLMVDFEVGREVGLGFGIESRFSAGLRYAEFGSSTSLESQGVPNWEVPDYGLYDTYAQHDYFDTDMTAKREFQGVGPMLSWEASKRLLGDEQRGSLHADWSLSGGVLFGKQETSFSGQEASTYYDSKYRPEVDNDTNTVQPPTPDGPPTITRGPEDRSASASVPTLGGSLGLSYRVDGASIGMGYRWERYYGVLDAGWDDHHDVDREIDGLYLKVTFGE